MQQFAQVIRSTLEVFIFTVCAFSAVVTASAQTPPDSRIVFDALGSFNTERAAQFFRSGASPNLTDDEGRSPLMYAAVADDIALARLLLELGANVNYRVPNSGLTPLMQAAAVASADFVGLLIDNGAKVNEMATTGSTAMHEAMMKNRHLSAQLLLQRGASPNVSIRQGTSTIYIVIHRNDEIGAKLLLKHGVDLSQRGPAYLPALSGKTPIEFAESRGRMNMVEILKSDPTAIVLPTLVNTERPLETGGPTVMTTGKIVAVDGHRLVLRSLQGNLLLRWLPVTSIGNGPGKMDSAATASLIEDLRRLDVVTVRHWIGDNRLTSISPGAMSIGNRQ